MDLILCGFAPTASYGLVFIYPVGDFLWFFSAIANTQAAPVASFSVHSGAQVRYVLDQCTNPASVLSACLQCVLRNCSSFLLVGSPWIALSLCLVHPSTVNPRNSEFTFSNVLSLLLPARPHSRWLHMRPPDWMQRTLSLT